MGNLCTTNTRVLPFDLDLVEPLSICQTCNVPATELQQPMKYTANYNQQFLCTRCGATWDGLKNLTPPDLPFIPLGSTVYLRSPKVASRRLSITGAGNDTTEPKT